MSITLYSGIIVEWSSIIADAKCKRRAWRMGHIWTRGRGWRSKRARWERLRWERAWERWERALMQEEDRDSKDTEFIDEVRESVEWFSGVDTEVHHETRGDESRNTLCTDLLLRLLG